MRSLSIHDLSPCCFPIIKYGKDKETKKIDYSKDSFRGKVPKYNGKWTTEVYDIAHNLIFPCDDPNITPMDFVRTAGYLPEIL